MTTRVWNLLTFCLVLVATSAQAAERPNVILFLVDDMGWMDSSVYGSQYYETPNMERLATQSMLFTDAYALPLCSPTRASILTGQYSSRHGVTSASGHQPPRPENVSRYPEKASPQQKLIYANSKNYLDLKYDTLSEVLQGAGYRTAHIGKWHLGLTPEYWPDKHGFDVAFHAQPSPGPPSYFSPYGVHTEGQPSGKHHMGTITDGPDGEYMTDRLTDEAIAFIEANQKQPFFLNFWQYGVHGPWGHKEEYTARYANKKDPRGEQRNPIMASMLQSIDESLGRLLERLDQLELTDNTLFIFYSDNGGNFHSNTPGSRQMTNIKPGHPKWDFVQDWKKWAGDEPPTNNAPLREGKGRIYEGGQRVPLMVRWPGHVQPGSTSDAVVGPIDLYPTILQATHIEPPRGHIIDGESLLPVLEQSGDLQREAYFTWFPHLIPAVSVRQGDWKLIRRFEPHREYPEVRELYNLKEDIGETNNLAKTHPDKVAELDTLIDQFIADTGALTPKPNPAYKPSQQAASLSPTHGLVARSCELVEADGLLKVTGTARNPFLGTAQVKMQGPLKCTVTIRAPQGGEGKIQWKTAGQLQFPETGQQVAYNVQPSEDWQTVTIPVPVEGMSGTTRLFLPAENSTIELKSIQFTNKQGSQKRWDFTRLDSASN
ncbi:MAG: N-acetylgalactosamine 6-sulfate sulfatase [Planctomyces sp.]|nr:N-acetylgalactosamine 6-sulfate sulfatase [Planctomyces sp.]